MIYQRTRKSSPPERAEGKVKVSKVFNCHRTKEINNINLPDWLLGKLMYIASKEDFFEFEQSEVIILAAEIRNYPEAAKVLPVTFCKKVQAQKPRELSPIERAAIVAVAWDQRQIIDLFCGLEQKERITRKFAVLAFALSTGDEI